MVFINLVIIFNDSKYPFFFFDYKVIEIEDLLLVYINVQPKV